MSTKIYPTLHEDPVDENEANFMPIIPLRRDNVDLTVNQSSELYITSKKLLRKIDLNIDELASQLNENPNIEDIDHACIMFGIDLQTTSNIGIWYLGEFFDYLGTVANVSVWDQMDDILNNFPATVNTLKKNVYDTAVGGGLEISEYGFNFKITFRSITTVLKNGSIGDKHTATKTLYGDTSGSTIRPFTDKELETEYMHTYPIYVKNPSNAKAVFRLQITDSVYKEITVYDLQHTNNIYRRYNIVTDLDDLISDTGNENFIVPVHYKVVIEMDRLLQNALYQESLHIIINSFERVKVKWYTTNWFRFVVLVISIILLIWSGGTSVWLNSLVVAIEAGVMAVIYWLLVQIVFSLVLKAAMKLVAELVGPEIAAIIAIVVAVVAMYSGGNMGNVSFMGASMPTSSFLLSASQCLLSASSEVIMEEVENVLEKSEDYSVLSDKKWNELKEIQETLDIDNPLSFDLLEAQNELVANPLTDPGQFYNLTIHIGNIGTHVLDIIPEFHSAALKLPNIDETSFTNNIFTV